MGASFHKPLKSILQSKYSFTHPKSRYVEQIACWKFMQEELEDNTECKGDPMKWPYKFYSDEGYIIILIQNKAINRSQIQQAIASKVAEQSNKIRQIKVSLNLLEILYSFYHGQIEEYFAQQIYTESQSKYITDKLSLKMYVYSGQNLSSKSKLKLMSYCIQFERYILRGGLCSISKLYHEYQQIADLKKQMIFCQSTNSKEKYQQYYVDLITLISEQRKNSQIATLKNQPQISLQIVYNRLQKYDLLKKSLFDLYQIDRTPLFQMFCSQNHKYNILDCNNWTKHKHLIVKSMQKKVSAKAQKRQQIKNQTEQPNLDDSSPFQCEITEINLKQKKKETVEGYLQDDSNLMDELSVLNEKKSSQFVKIVCEQEDYIVLTDYTSIRDFKKINQLNIQLVINLGAHTCYNYYLNDIKYLHYYITPLPTKPPTDNILFQYNIENIIYPITQSIISTTIGNKPNDTQNNRVVIHSTTGLFSDENCAVIIGYLISRYLYTFQKAFALLSKTYKNYKKGDNSPLLLNKVYADQLLTLEGRVLMTSVSNYGVSLNTGYWKVFQLSNNHFSPEQTLIPRFIGQINNINQLNSLPNQAHLCFIVLHHQLVATLSQIVQKWEKDPNIKPPQPLPGLKLVMGKQFSFREEFSEASKKIIPLIIKFQLVNRSKFDKSFNNQFLFKFIEAIVSTNLQEQYIQKSFRKPQPFQPLSVGFQEQNPSKMMVKAPLPYNSKQKLTIKYPFLRPTWQALKDDEYYFIMQVTKAGASIQIVKGKNWSGYQMDKQTFFASIVEHYLMNVEQQKIWVNQEGEESLFGEDI